MRTTHDDATVRLYHLDGGPEGGAAETLFYGPLTKALDIAAAQSEAAGRPVPRDRQRRDRLSRPHRGIALAPPSAPACLIGACLIGLLPAAPATARDSLGIWNDWGAFRDAAVPRCYAIAMAQPSLAARAISSRSSPSASGPGATPATKSTSAFRAGSGRAAARCCRWVASRSNWRPGRPMPGRRTRAWMRRSSPRCDRRVK
jgi:hypothetical protein